jgi:ABC-type Zn uptake system ZnuABC Zn-binding protein ZnuA
MKNHKNILNIVIAIMLIVPLGIIISKSVNAVTKDNNQIKVMTTLPLLKNIVEKIGGRKVNVNSIVKGPNCDHEYEASAGDMKKVATCDIFFKIGMGSDPWADKLVGTLEKNVLFIDSSRGIKTITVHHLENPHYWGSPANVKIMAQNILKSLIKVAPSDQDDFTQNFQQFCREIDQTAAELKLKAAKVKGKEFVSYAGAFPYFYQYFGFKNIATVEISCEREVTPKDLAEAVKLIKAKHIKVLIGDAAEPTEPDGLAKEIKARKVLIWATTNESNDYLMTLRYNVNLLVAALQ